MRQAVAAECTFVREALPDGTFDTLTAADMVGYVEYIADGLLRKFGVKAVYGGKLPKACRYMDMIGVDQKTNFFESRVTSYHKHEPSRLETEDFTGSDF
jgi:ribonucleoside-diphosphate reductase beta chain